MDRVKRSPSARDLLVELVVHPCGKKHLEQRPNNGGDSLLLHVTRYVLEYVAQLVVSFHLKHGEHPRQWVLPAEYRRQRAL